MEMASSDGASVEPVNSGVSPSTGNKGKRNLVSDDNLQPTPKKTYNLRNRKPKLSEEEVATRTPLSNRRTAKRLAESDSGFEVTSKKSYYSRKKISTLSEDEVSKDSQEGKEIVSEEMEDMKGGVETDTHGFKEFMGDMVPEEERQNVGGGNEDSKENLKVTIMSEEIKEELGIQKGIESTDGKNLQKMEEILEMGAKACAVNDEGRLVSIKEEQSVAEEIKDIRESLEVVTNTTVEETKEGLGIRRGNVEVPLEISTKASTVNDEGQLGIQKGTESTDQEKLQNMQETLEMSAKACAGNDDGQLVSNKEEQSVAEEIEDVKECLEVATNISVEDTKEELVFEEEKQNVGEEIEDIIENSEVTITTEETMEELGIQKGTESIGGKKLQNTEETLEMSAEACAVNDEVQLVFEEEKQNVGEEIEDIIENSKVTITTEETKEELGIQKGTESTAGGNLQNTEETSEMSAEACAVNDEGQLVCNKEEQSVAEEIEDVKESLEVFTNITDEETKEELVSHKLNRSVDVEVGNGNTILVKCGRSFLEESVAKLCSTEVKEYIKEETTDMEELSAEVNAEIVAEEANKNLGSRKETKGMDEETEDMNVPSDEVRGQLASHEGGAIDEERKDVVESCKVSRSGCMTDFQEKPEDEVISAKETLEIGKTACVKEAKEDKSFASIPKPLVATRSKIPKTPVATPSKILFMGNLPYSVDRKTVLSFFEDVGHVVDIRMAKNADGSMKGFCHVTFATVAAAVKALEKNGEPFHNRNVKLDLAENLSNKHVLGSTVLVRGLERSQPEEDIQKSLMKHFGDCGSIQNIHIPKDIQAGDSRRVAFIRFEDIEAVSKAVKLCGSELGDSKLFVKEVGRSRFRRKSSNAKRRNSKRSSTK